MFPDDEEGILYDSPDPNNREPISRADYKELPMLHENEQVWRIFKEDGYEVARRVPRFLRNAIPLGVMIDFSKIHEMFGPPLNDDDDDDDDDDDGPRQRPAFNVFPQAGMLSCGHIASKGLMYPYHRFLDNLNKSLVQSDDNTVDDWLPTNEPAVVGIGCQMYNSMMHNTRGNSTQHHGVVLGNVTAALAGHWAQSTPLTNTAQKFIRSCDKQLPHEEYLHKITDRPISRDLRVENVFGISMASIHPDKQTGR